MVIDSFRSRLQALALCGLCIVCLVAVSLALPVYALRGSPRAWRMIVAIDRLGNALLGGSDTETLSSRAYRVETLDQRRWACVLCRLLRWITRSEHCKNSSGI